MSRDRTESLSRLSRCPISALALLGLFWLPAGGGVSLAQSYGGLDTSFELALVNRESPPLGLELELVSTRTYPCAGYRILSSVRWHRDTLTVAVLGLRRPSPCVPLSSVARATVFLGDLGDTTIVLCVTYRGYKDRYRIAFYRRGKDILPLHHRFTSLRR